jgi:hypothetical protein
MNAMGFVLGSLAWVATVVAAPADEGRPLVVVVDSMPGTSVDASGMRRQIAEELGRPVLAPGDARADMASDLLLVVVEGETVRMSLHGGSTDVVARRVALPADRAARLKMVGWLAGNLARDQVGSLIATVPDGAAPSAAAPPEATPPPSPPAVPSPPHPDLAPPSFTPAAPMTARPAPTAATVSARPAPPAAAADGRWAITAAVGPTTVFNSAWSDLWHGSAGVGRVVYAPVLQLEAQRRLSGGPFFLGLALQLGPDGSPPTRHYAGVATIAGARWRDKDWFIEASVGAGVERAQVFDANLFFAEANTGAVYGGYVYVTRFQAFGRVAGTVGVPLRGSWDAVVQAAVHITGSQSEDFAALTGGVRVRLP